MNRYRVVIVDVATVIAEGVASILSRSSRCEVLGSYSSIAEIQNLLIAGRVDIVVASVALLHQIEECAELIQALSKYHRASGKGQPIADYQKTTVLDNIIEEIADVEVMLEQIKYLLNISEDDISAVIQAKTIRQKKRMQGE
jgi:DNA-binding NarL/FixJ family response regulator